MPSSGDKDYDEIDFGELTKWSEDSSTDKKEAIKQPTGKQPIGKQTIGKDKPVEVIVNDENEEDDLDLPKIDKKKMINENIIINKKYALKFNTTLAKIIISLENKIAYEIEVDLGLLLMDERKEVHDYDETFTTNMQTKIDSIKNEVDVKDAEVEETEDVFKPCLEGRWPFFKTDGFF